MGEREILRRIEREEKLEYIVSVPARLLRLRYQAKFRLNDKFCFGGIKDRNLKNSSKEKRKSKRILKDE